MPSRSDINYDRAKVKGFPVYIRQNLKPARIFLNDKPKQLFKLLKTGPLEFQADDSDFTAGNEWVGFEIPEQGYTSIFDISVSRNVKISVSFSL